MLRWCLVLLVATAIPSLATAQVEAVSGLLDRATDFNFYWTRVGIPDGSLKAEKGSAIDGFGFELAFEIPGGIPKRKRVPSVRQSVPPGATCETRFERGTLRQDQECADTTVKSVKRIRSGREWSYEEELEIKDFKWVEPVVYFELAVGFSQAGTLVARDGANEVRASLREAPSVALYGNYDLPIGNDHFGLYFGARSGLVSLVGGRAYREDETLTFEATTFQLGPVLGLVTSARGLNLFVEGSYMWRDFKSLEWDTESSIGSLPRNANASGPVLAVGVQFQFQTPEG